MNFFCPFNLLPVFLHPPIPVNVYTLHLFKKSNQKAHPSTYSILSHPNLLYSKQIRNTRVARQARSHPPRNHQHHINEPINHPSPTHNNQARRFNIPSSSSSPMHPISWLWGLPPCPAYLYLSWHRLAGSRVWLITCSFLNPKPPSSVLYGFICA